MLDEFTLDRRDPRNNSKNRPGAHLPMSADIPQDIDVASIQEEDPHASAIGMRGIGEVSVGAAITDGIDHPTGAHA